MFNNTSGERYEAQSGIFAFPGGNDVFPNHTSDYVVDKDSFGLNNSITLISNVNSIKLIREISLEEKGYEISVKTRVVNGKNQDIDAGIYYQLVRTSNPPRGGSSFYQTFTGPAFYSEKEKFQWESTLKILIITIY